jgi:hypothetical protein
MALPGYWFHRKFGFDFEASTYPAILMRLRGAPVRLAELCRDLPAGLLTRRDPLAQDTLAGPHEGRWSIQEHVGHLAVMDATLWEQRIDDYIAGREVLTAADLQNTATDAADFNAMSLDAVLAQFNAARAGFLKRLDALAPEDFSRIALHPRLQTPMRLVDGLYFSAEHDDHHMAWIWEIARA